MEGKRDLRMVQVCSSLKAISDKTLLCFWWKDNPSMWELALVCHPAWKRAMPHSIIKLTTRLGCILVGMTVIVSACLVVQNSMLNTLNTKSFWLQTRTSLPGDRNVGTPSSSLRKSISGPLHPRSTERSQSVLTRRDSSHLRGSSISKPATPPGMTPPSLIWICSNSQFKGFRIAQSLIVVQCFTCRVQN